MLHTLDMLGRDLMIEFNVNREMVHARVKDMTIRSVNGSLSCIQTFFYNANRVSETK